MSRGISGIVHELYQCLLCNSEHEKYDCFTSASKSQAKKRVSCGSLPPKSKAIREGNSGRYSFLFKNFKKLEQFIYNVVLVSGVQQSESVIYTHIYTHIHIYIDTHISTLFRSFSHICHYSESESRSVTSDSFQHYGL